MYTTPQTTGELLDLFTKILKSYKRAMWIPNFFLYSYCRMFNLNHGICYKSYCSYDKELPSIFSNLYTNDIKYKRMYISPVPKYTSKRIKQECFLPRIVFLKREIARLSQLPADASLKFYSELRDSMK